MPTDPVTLLREGPQPAVYVCLSCMRQISLMEVWQVQEPERSAPTYTHHTVDGHPVVRIDGLLPTDAGGCEELRALVREWQIARRPSHLPAPGVDVVETYRHAVLRMTVVDEALARFNLDGPAGGALVGQTTPTESTGPFTDEYAVEMLTHLARTLPEIDEQHSCLRGALAIKAIAARARGVGRAISNARAVYLAPPEAACVHVGDVVNAEPVDVDPDLVVSVEAGMVSTQQGDTFPLSSVRHVWKPTAPPEAAPMCDCADDVCQAAKHDGILCADGECDYHSGIRKPPEAAPTVTVMAVGMCPECGPVSAVDAERCCTGCGHDVAMFDRPTPVTTRNLRAAPTPEPDSAEWWRQVAQGLGVEVAKLKAERPRCEWRPYPGGPQCTRTAGHGLPHETRSDGTCGMRHETGARCTLPDGHTENHRGEFAGGVAQWPKETKSMSVTVPKDHPLMVAWTAYKDTEDYANTRRWAAHDAHVDGSLWAAFERGWLAAGGRKPFEAPPAPHAEAVRVLEEVKRSHPADVGSWGRSYVEGVRAVLATIDAKLAALRAEGEGGDA